VRGPWVTGSVPLEGTMGPWPFSFLLYFLAGDVHYFALLPCSHRDALLHHRPKRMGPTDH
jgi:hypothetical protein